MVHHRRTHTVSVSLLYSTIFHPYSFCMVGGKNVEYANGNCYLSIGLLLLPLLLKLTLFRDVGFSSSYIAPTD